MKNLICIFLFFISVCSFAQTEPATPNVDSPANAAKKGDTLTTSAILKRETDLEKSDAVKTQDHVKTAPPVVKKKKISSTPRKRKYKAKASTNK
jgi:hypothetical protein